MPTVAHVIYIPGMLLVGFALGFRFGAKAARAELEKQAQRRKK